MTEEIVIGNLPSKLGIPKPMIFTNDWIAKVIAASILSPPADHTGVESYFKTGRFFMTLPSFHVRNLT